MDDYVDQSIPKEEISLSLLVIDVNRNNKKEIHKYRISSETWNLSRYNQV